MHEGCIHLKKEYKRSLNEDRTLAILDNEFFLHFFLPCKCIDNTKPNCGSTNRIEMSKRIIAIVQSAVFIYPFYLRNYRERNIYQSQQK